MSVIESVLGGIDGGKVLDVATQEGHFIQILIEYLKSFQEILGVDIHEKAIEKARSTIRRSDVRFLVMNAEKLIFEDACFDTVTISASLHHLSNIPQVLAEMVRVLKPGGHFIIVEMHRDGQTDAVLTSVYLHHWVAEVDTALGYFHNRTLSRQEFSDFVSNLGLNEVTIHLDRQPDSDPKEQARIEQLEDLIDRTMQRAEHTSNASELKARGVELRKRLHKIGAQKEPTILIAGVK